MVGRRVWAQLDNHLPGVERHDQEVLWVLGHHFTSTGISTSQAWKAGPFSFACRATSALNHAPAVSMTRIFGRSLGGKSESTRTRSILSCGSATGSPTLIARTTSCPWSTRPQAV